MLKQTIYYTTKLWIGSFLGRCSTSSSLMTYESPKELRMKCKTFSENDPLLEQVLYELNRRNIKTYACCKGHSEAGGYLAIRVKPEQEEQMNQIATQLWKVSHATVSIHGYHASFDGTTMNIYFRDSEKKVVLEQILRGLIEKTEDRTFLFQSLFDCVRLQATVHRDLMFGLYMTPVEGGYKAQIETPFMFHYSDCYVAPDQLEMVLGVMHDMGEFMEKNVLTEAALEDFVLFLNGILVGVEKSQEVPWKDYYEGMDTQELKQIMDEKGEYVGAITDLIHQHWAHRLTEEDTNKLVFYANNWREYIGALKRESSYQAKQELYNCK